MKIALTFVFYALVLQLFAQSISEQDCKAIKLDVIQFVSHNPNYLDNSNLFSELGKCYGQSSDFLINKEKYNIANFVEPELAFLLIHSESISEIEKQEWFDMLGSMSLAKIEELYEILLNERLKLVGIENKYNSNNSIEDTYILSLEKENITKSDLLFLCRDKDVIRLVKFISEDKVSDFYYNDSIETYNVNFITPESHEVIPLITIKTDFQKFIEQYKTILVKSNKQTWLAYLKFYPDYTFQWYKYILKSYDKYELNDLDVERMLSISDIFTNNKSNYNLQASRNYFEVIKIINDVKKKKYLYNADYRNSCNMEINSQKKNVDKPLIFEDLTFSLTKMPLYYFYCDKTAFKSLSQIILSRYNQQKDKLSPTKINTNYILLDFVSLFSSDEEVINMVKGLKDQLNESFTSDIKNYSNSWYFNLTLKYINDDFKRFLTYNDIQKEVISLKKLTNNDDNINASLSEYLLSYIIYQMKYVPNYDIKNIKQLIGSLKQLFNDRDTKYFFYVQNYISNFLIDKIKIIEEERISNINKFALIVGVSDYKFLDKNIKVVNLNTLSDLKYAAKDAEDIDNLINKGYFIGKQWNSTLLIDENATSDSVHKKIENMFSSAKKNDIIFLYFSGHAEFDKYDELYLLTSDYKRDEIYKNISEQWLNKRILNSSCENVFVFIDACNTGISLENSKGNKKPNYFLMKEIRKIGNKKLIFVSSSASQKSFESDEFKNGIFTHFIIKGLQGYAPDYNNDGYINTGELTDYVRDSVNKYSYTNFNTTQLPQINFETNSKEYPLSIRKQYGEK